MCLELVFQWVLHNKCIPAWNKKKASVMRMLERHPTEVVDIKTIINILIILPITMISVFKFCVIWGIFLTWFADSLLFDMMIQTSYKDGVKTVQDLIDRDMSLGK